jgi:hypothetical protein
MSIQQNYKKETIIKQLIETENKIYKQIVNLYLINNKLFITFQSYSQKIFGSTI